MKWGKTRFSQNQNSCVELRLDQKWTQSENDSQTMLNRKTETCRGAKGGFLTMPKKGVKTINNILRYLSYKKKNYKLFENTFYIICLLRFETLNKTTWFNRVTLAFTVDDKLTIVRIKFSKVQTYWRSSTTDIFFFLF